MQAADELAQLGQGQHGLVVRGGDGQPDRFGFGVEPLPGHAEVHGQRDQPLLRAVVQVPLDPAAFGVGRVDQVGAAAGQRLDPQRQLLAGPRAEQRPGQPLVRPGHLPGQPGPDGKQHRQQGTAGPGDHRQRVESELAPGRGREPRPGQPRRGPGGPGRGGDLHPERRPDPRPLQQGEPLHHPRQQHQHQHVDGDEDRGVLPAARPPAPGSPAPPPRSAGGPAEQEASRPVPASRPARRSWSRARS